MKLLGFVSFEKSGAGWGAAFAEGVVDGRRLIRAACPSLRTVIEAGLLDRAAAEAGSLVPDTALDDVVLLPVIPDPRHIFCAGLNYTDHAAETGKAAPAAPRMFLRASSSLTGHGRPVIRPRVSDKLDFEGELAVVIGKPGRHILKQNAMEHVAGYTCFMDGSIRDWQEHSVTTGKNFATTGALGPWLVPASVLHDPTALRLSTSLNGDVMQQVTTDRMIHTIPALIAYLSAMTTLHAGDVIATGTPEGIGHRRSPPLYMRAGDRIEVEISGIGVLSNPIADEVT